MTPERLEELEQTSNPSKYELLEWANEMVCQTLTACFSKGRSTKAERKDFAEHLLSFLSAIAIFLGIPLTRERLQRIDRLDELEAADADWALEFIQADAVECMLERFEVHGIKEL